MGFMDTLKNQALGAASNTVLGSLTKSSPAAASMLEMINNHPGGLNGLVQAFHENGMGDVVRSWVGSGQNLPISADQITNVLGDERVQQIAGKLGISPDDAKAKLAEFLPTVVDKMTPGGQVPDSSS